MKKYYFAYGENGKGQFMTDIYCAFRIKTAWEKACASLNEGGFKVMRFERIR